MLSKDCRPLSCFAREGIDWEKRPELVFRAKARVNRPATAVAQLPRRPTIERPTTAGAACSKRHVSPPRTGQRAGEATMNFASAATPTADAALAADQRDPGIRGAAANVV